MRCLETSPMRRSTYGRFVAPITSTPSLLEPQPCIWMRNSVRICCVLSDCLSELSYSRSSRRNQNEAISCLISCPSGWESLRSLFARSSLWHEKKLPAWCSSTKSTPYVRAGQACLAFLIIIKLLRILSKKDAVQIMPFPCQDYYCQYEHVSSRNPRIYAQRSTA